MIGSSSTVNNNKGVIVTSQVLVESGTVMASVELYKLWLGFVLVNKERNNIHITTHPISCWVNAVLVSNDLPELGTDLVASVCPREFKHIEKQVGFPIKRFPIKRIQNT